MNKKTFFKFKNFLCGVCVVFSKKKKMEFFIYTSKQIHTHIMYSCRKYTYFVVNAQKER